MPNPFKMLKMAEAAGPMVGEVINPLVEAVQKIMPMAFKFSEPIAAISVTDAMKAGTFCTGDWTARAIKALRTETEFLGELTARYVPGTSTARSAFAEHYAAGRLGNNGLYSALRGELMPEGHFTGLKGEHTWLEEIVDGSGKLLRNPEGGVKFTSNQIRPVLQPSLTGEVLKEALNSRNFLEKGGKILPNGERFLMINSETTLRGTDKFVELKTVLHPDYRPPVGKISDLPPSMSSAQTAIFDNPPPVGSLAMRVRSRLSGQ